MMIRDKLKKYGLFLAGYMILAVAFFLIGGKQLKEIEQVDIGTVSRGVMPEFITNQVAEQTFVANADELRQISFMVATYARENQGNIEIMVESASNHEILAQEIVDVATMEDNSEYVWTFEKPIVGYKGENLTLKLVSECESGQAITLYYGDVQDGQEPMYVNGEAFAGQLHLTVSGVDYSLFGTYYWLWVIGGGAMGFAYMAWSDYQESRGKLTKGKLISVIWKKYRFLIEQLVARDFKTKYKRSVLGYLWSFLNPLLTMLVQYIVFSTIFKSGIENYPVYLLSGIILFNFFSESVGQGLGAIVYNASLITKVYVPKYIYPVTKVASTSINLFISIIPLILVTMMTGVKVTPAILLLPFVLGCLLLFCVGMVLMLSAAMVFFRDTQYLWGIVSMVWMYATPLFYPENIIPSHFRFIQTLNPMYHMIKFARIIFIDGVSPAPMLYGACIISALVTCVIGAFVFKKTQNKFVLYI